jgi:HAD superfamily hydrolase (TIGR01459 family)
MLDEALKYNLPAICPNPDLRLSDFRYCAGFFAEYYKNKGGIVHYVGKPYKNIFDYMYENIQEKVDLSKIILIGDTFYTDILGANNYGIKSGLVLTGNSKVLTKGKAQSENEEIAVLMEESKNYKATPDYFIHLGL